MYIRLHFKRFKELKTPDGKVLALEKEINGFALGYSPISVNRKINEYGQDPSVEMFELYTRGCKHVEVSDKIEFLDHNYDVVAVDCYSVDYQQRVVIARRVGL